MSDDAILREKRRRLRKLKEQQARSGIDTRRQIETEIEDLAAEIAKREGAGAALPRPPKPDFAHPYPIQASFTGRVAERKMLTAWLGSSAQPILALVAIGGMVQRDVLGLPLPGAAEAPEVSAACRLPDAARPEGMLWWSWTRATAPRLTATPRLPGSARGVMGRRTATSRRWMRPSGCWGRSAV